MPKQIKPTVKEISLAFDPANMKKFLLRKEAQKGNGGDNKMAKEAIIKALVEGDEYPFVKDDTEWLNSLSEETLTKMQTFKKEKVDKDAIKAELRKEVEAEIKEQVRKDLEKEIREQIKTELEKDKKTDPEILNLKKELKESQDVISVMQKELEDERNLRLTKEMEAFIKDNGVPGDAEKLTKTLVSLKKSNEEAFVSMKESLKAAGDAVLAAGVFSEIGHGGDSDVSSAYQRLQKEKEKIMEKDKIGEAAAWKKAIRDNPTLYKEYIEKRA